MFVKYFHNLKLTTLKNFTGCIWTQHQPSDGCEVNSCEALFVFAKASDIHCVFKKVRTVVILNTLGDNIYGWCIFFFFRMFEVLMYGW